MSLLVLPRRWRGRVYEIKRRLAIESLDHNDGVGDLPRPIRTLMPIRCSERSF